MQIQPTEFQDQLVRGLAHRMNNILTLFHGYVGLMLENSELDKTTREGLNKIRDGATAASELMDRAHSLVRPSALVWREIDVAEFLMSLRPTFDGFCRPSTAMEIIVPSELPPVWADSGRVKTAIVELVRNACEAACEKGGSVRINASVEAATGKLNATPGNSAVQPLKWVVISITDNGPGIEPSAEERIFQPFYSTKKRQNAAGLGLTVASGVVQQLGGILRFESKPGRTCFQVLLPARSEPR
jgi:signal transduction histidine kinase